MNITDALDSYLQAKLKIGQWGDEFLGKFYKPLMDMMLNQAIDNARNSPMIDKNVLEKRLSPEGKRRLRGE